jgi:antitoxin VapB
MARTRIFKSGNSQAVRIPAELAYDNVNVDLEIRRPGDVITIFPVRDSLKDVCDTLLRMRTPPEIEGREPIEVPDRRQD